MLTQEDKNNIRRTWRLVVPIAETAADLFYKRLFELKPEYRSLFPADMSSQKKKLLKMLAFVVRALDFPEHEWQKEVPIEEDLLLIVLALGRRHSELYAIPEDSYSSVGEALIWTLDYGLGEAFTESVQTAWVKVYMLLARTMKLGSKLSDREAALVPASAALQLGEEALIVDMAELGIDEDAMAMSGDAS